MGFKYFVKLANKDKILFFQSSYPYLHKNGLSLFRKFLNKKWKFDDPHATSSQFLFIDTGHYGLYYTVFNHDADRNNLGPAKNFMNFEYVANYRDQVRTIVYLPYFGNFFILEAKKDILNDINYIKSITKEFLSTLSYVKPKLRYIDQRRYFSTKPYNQITHVVDEYKPQLEEKINDSNKYILEAEDSPFEEDFLNTQLKNIKSIYLNSKSPDDLNIIYPLYQSIKRNDIQLPDVELYNMVLRSIVERSLDNVEVSVESVESRLTTLMTVYQDLLNANLRPNKDTFNIILESLFKGSSQVLNLASKLDTPPNMCTEALSKCEQYSSLGIELFMSIKNINELDLGSILPSLLTILNNYPSLLKVDLLKKLHSLLSLNINKEEYYSGLIRLSFYLRQHDIIELDKETYDFVASIYENYKKACSLFAELDNSEFIVYKYLIQAMIQNGNFPLATKFLDDIIMDYKSSLISSTKPSKSEISELISSYIEALITHSPVSNSLESAYDLLLKFNNISYIPEMSVSLYNTMINNFIKEYYLLEKKVAEKGVDINAIRTKQISYYNIIWELYNHVSIRKDFQGNSFFISHSSPKSFCRDSILSYSIDLGDNEKVFQLIKEILMKNHIIKDPNTLGKLSYYLYYGTISNGLNTQYFELLWNVIEEQSKFYNSSSKNLSNFVADYLKYLIISNDEYNINLLTNSLMIKECFETFDLQQDNLYVAFSVTKSLIDYVSNYDIKSKEILQKILYYESLIINELENTENHYIDLGEDWNQFKSSLKSSFIHLLKTSQEYKDFSYSIEMKNACELLDVDINHDDSKDINNSHYNINISHLLNTNYKLGVEKFLKMFREGYTFNKRTWQIIINSNFIIDATTNKINLDIYDFVKRLIKLDFEFKAKEELLVSLIQMKIDKANIQVSKYLFDLGLKFESNSIYLNMIEALEISDNIYLREIYYNNFEKLYQSNKSFHWITPYLMLMEEDQKNDKIISISETIGRNFDLLDPLEIDALAIILQSFINQGKHKDFDNLFKFYFNSSDKLNAVLKKSDKLSALLMKYYNLRGNFDLVLTKFKSFSGRSTEATHEFQFAKYMKCLLLKTTYPLDISTLSEISFALIGNDLNTMNKLYLENSVVINSQRENLVEMTLSNLTRVGSTTNFSNMNQILLNKFQNFIRFLMLIKCKSISTDNLVSIIDFLATINAKEILGVLLNKLIFENKCTKMINFYLLEVRIFTNNQRIKVLKAMHNSFKKLNDEHSISLIKDFASTNNLVIN